MEVAIFEDHLRVSRDDKIFVRPESSFPILAPESPLPPGVIFIDAIDDLRKVGENGVVAAIWKPAWHQELLDACYTTNLISRCRPNIFSEAVYWPWRYRLDEANTVIASLRNSSLSDNLEFDPLFSCIKSGVSYSVIKKTFETMAEALLRTSKLDHTLQSTGRLQASYPGFQDSLHRDGNPTSPYMQGLVCFNGQGTWILVPPPGNPPPSLIPKQSFAEMDGFRSDVYQVPVGCPIFWYNDLVHSGATVLRPRNVRLIGILATAKAE